VRRYSVGTGALQQTLTGPPFQVYGLDVQAGGRLLAASGREGVARLWDPGATPPRRKTIRLFPAHRWVQGLAFSPEGRYLATGNPDGTVYLLRVPEALPDREPLEVRPVEKGGSAPDLSRAKPLYLDTFADPHNGFGEGSDRFAKWGYVGGKYVMELNPGSLRYQGRGARYEDFACEVIGRVEGHPKGAWGVYVTEVGARRGVRVSLDGEGRWTVAPVPEAEPNRAPYAGPVAHRAAKRGNESNKLVVVQGRRLEVYVNGEAVCEPVILDRGLTPAYVGLYGATGPGKARLEFERLTIWPAPGR
jgi:hypothetical protein